ncbi:MAG TPA: carboxypeptidase-like regulatory domain-containing protein [Planctomycetota bacterium]
MARRALLVGLLLAIAAIAVWLLREDPGPDATSPRGAPAQPMAAPETVALPSPGSSPTPSSAVARVDASGDIELIGRVVDEQKAPVGGIAVHLAEDPPLSPFAMLARQQRGAFLGSLASTSTGVDGSFRLVVPTANAAAPLQVVALGVVHGDACQRRVRSRGRTTDIGEIVLVRGMPVRGSVVDAATAAPLAGAVVTALPPSLQLLRLPERGEGRTAVANSIGEFVFPGLAPGSWTFRAEAIGHATEERPQQAVFADQPTELHFELSPGRELTGIVVTAGANVADAQVTAVATGTDDGRVAARSDQNGRFVLAGLGPGTYRVTAGKQAYRTAIVEDVVADREGLQLTLEPQGAIRLRVVDAGGAAVTAYEVAPVLVGAPRVQTEAPRSVLAAELGSGAYLLADLDAGEWNVHVKASGFAPATSGPVPVGAGALAEARIVLEPGATLRLQLRSSSGRALGGSTVTLQPDGFADGPVAAALGSLVRDPFDAASATTNGEGFATLPALGAGTWQLRIDRKGHAPFYVRDVTVARNAHRDLGPVVLPDGARLSGLALVDGVVDRTIEVQVLALAGGNLPAGYRVTAPVDGEGRWRSEVLLPPGRYAVMAGRRRADDPFLENQDHTASRREVELAAGAVEVRVELSLKRRGS